MRLTVDVDSLYSSTFERRLVSRTVAVATSTTWEIGYDQIQNIHDIYEDLYTHCMKQNDSNTV